MTRHLISRARGTVLGALALLGLLGACKDAPTMPHALQRLVGGEEWVALDEPRGLPRLDTWMPYLQRSTAEGREAFSRVRELERKAERARRGGRLMEAAELAREAERVAVLSLARYPDPRVLRRALGALDAWMERVRLEVALDRAPGMAAALDGVERARGEAVALLAVGDTSAALLQLASAAERVREHTPSAVAQRVLVQAEQRLAGEATAGAEVERALHLLAAARQELIDGDPVRALQRALYALQIVEGSEVRTVESDSSCLGPAC